MKYPAKTKELECVSFMAKNVNGPDDHAKVKFRVIEFELEGANAAVENSVRNLTTVIMQKNGAVAPAKPALRGSGAGPVLPAAPAVTEVAEEPENFEQPVVGTEAEAVESSPAKPRGPRKLPVPDVIAIDLTSGDMPFEKYCQGKKLDTDWNKCLACAMWLKEYRALPTITDDHIYTIFKFMKWPVPGDVSGPLRGMKKQGWFTTPERGKYAINHLGENEVNRMAAA
jgi:hypothetical protein